MVHSSHGGRGVAFNRAFLAWSAWFGFKSCYFGLECVFSLSMMHCAHGVRVSI